jgi:PilZ domain-containing protein
LALIAPRTDLRRHPRARVAWKIMIEMAGSRPRMRKTVDVSPFGVKVRLNDRLPNGTAARLCLATPDRRPFAMNAIVKRSDVEGPVFVFIGVGEEEVMRLRSLVDSYHSI